MAAERFLCHANWRKNRDNVSIYSKRRSEMNHVQALGPDAAVELAPGALHAVGGVLPYDDRLSWAPAGARGLQPINAYLLTRDGEPLLIDTGVAAHCESVMAGLDALLAEGQELSIFLTRSEYECIGNLPAVAARFAIRALFTGGVTNPFDAFDEVASPHALWNRRIRLGRASQDDPVRVGGTESLQVFPAPIRILTTYWAYDEATKTLFTSDLFGHGAMDDGSSPRMLADDDSCSTHEIVRDALLAKFGWLDGAAKVDVARDALKRVFDRYEVDIIAPTHGLPIVGPAAVQRHLGLLLGCFAEFEARATPPATGSEAPVADAVRVRPRPGATRPVDPRLPRPLAPNVQWLGKCIEDSTVEMRGTPHHSHLSLYLISGASETLLVDTGVPSGWPTVQAQLAELLGDRRLDYVFPTHPEYPHSGNLEKLMETYPTARIIGDVRDYHVYFPAITERTLAVTAGSTVDLGGGCRVIFLPGVLRDLPSTLWLYEELSQIMFVADGFGFFHREPAGEDPDEDDSPPQHSPGECALMVSELDADLEVVQASTIVKNALSWSRYVDATPLFVRIHELLNEYPARIIAPAHGNVIDCPAEILPLIEESHGVAFRTGQL